MRAEVRELDRDDPLLGGFRDCHTYKATTRFWAGFWDGELAAIWGIAPNSAVSDTAFIWSVGYPVLAKCRRMLLIVTRSWLRAMAQDFTTLVGTCDDTTALVKHMGATFGEAKDGFRNFVIKV